DEAGLHYHRSGCDQRRDRDPFRSVLRAREHPAQSGSAHPRGSAHPSRTIALMPQPSVSFVIPMFNEEENIDHAIDAAVEALTKYTDDYEIIIVDDASTD